MDDVTSSPPGTRRIGVIINPRSHANKANSAGLDAVLARHPDVRSVLPAGRAALQDALSQFAAERIDLIVVSGGDGTLRDVLSGLPLAYRRGLPEIAILSAGNTNLAARVLGSPGRGGAALEKLLLAAARNRLRRKVCPILEVSWPAEPARAPISGFFFGAAGFAEAKRFANARLQKHGVYHGFEVGVAAVVTVFRVLLGRDKRIARGWQMTLTVEGGPAVAGNRFLVLATTLDSLMLGLWPFWGRGGGGIRWLDIDAPPRRFGAGLLAVLLRQPRPWMEDSGYRSGRAGTVRLMLDQPFILDGEAFEPGSGVLLSASASVTVVTP